MKKITTSRSLTPREDPSVERYLRDIAMLPRLSLDEEITLAQRIHQGDREAFDRMVEGNLRFVITVAKKYQGMGLELVDLIAAGNIGLMKAADRFDETHGFRFLSYAVWYINKEIMEALSMDSRMVRMPKNKINMLSRVFVATKMLEQELNRMPSTEEVAETIGEDPADVGELLMKSANVGSLNARVGDDDGQTLEEVLPDQGGARADGTLMQESLVQEINIALGMLNERDQTILRMYYGLGMERESSLEEVGSVVGLTNERVRQRIKKSLMRLKKSQHSSVLASFL